MRRFVALPALLVMAGIVIAFGGTRFGKAADRLCISLVIWADHPA